MKRAKKLSVQHWNALKARSKVIEFFNDYPSVVSEAKNEATKRKGLKILTPKQMLQRMLIALASQ